jgi:hypothetical protein
MQAGEERPARRPAWGLQSKEEPRWPATLALIAALILYVELPEKLIYGPPGVNPTISRWTVPVLELALILPLQFATPHRRLGEMKWRRLAAIGLIALINLVNLASLVLLVHNVIHGRANTGLELIFSAILIWLTNVIVFGLWYWELDRGGPGARCAPEHREPDFLFPQMSNPDAAPSNWTPTFLDYLYVSFTNASAFSPTDTMPLTQWAKILMAVQATAALLTVGVVAARAVNILR